MKLPAIDILADVPNVDFLIVTFGLGVDFSVAVWYNCFSVVSD